MTIKLNILISVIITFFISSCLSKETNDTQQIGNDFPKELQNIPLGIQVIHSHDTVYATINTKDPERRGKYQLQFSTSVKSINQTLEVTEFSCYIKNNGKWVMRTIYNRPFNSEEFEKWYHCPNGILKLDETYTDTDNWIGKTNKLSGKTINAILYVKAIDTNGIEYIGYESIVGIIEFNPNYIEETSITQDTLTDNTSSPLIQAIETILKSEKIELENEFLRLSNRSLKIVEQGILTIENQEYYQLNVAEDNGVAFSNHYTFYVGLNNGEILFLDTVNNEIIDFEEWKKL